MYSNTEACSIRMASAMDLLRFKALKKLQQGHFAMLDTEDVNEILTVAGMALVTPEEINIPELKIITAEKETDNDTV